MTLPRRAALMLMALVLVACSAPDESTRTLEKSGYTNIETTGWEPFSCGEKDSFSTGFRATNPSGQPVEGVVCCGVIKRCTVRFSR